MGFLARPKKRTSWRRAWRVGSRGIWRKARLAALGVALLSGGSAYGLLAPLADGRVWNMQLDGASSNPDASAYATGMARDSLALLAQDGRVPVQKLAWMLSLQQAEEWVRQQWRRWWEQAPETPAARHGQGRRRATDAMMGRRSATVVRGWARVIDGDTLQVAGVRVRLHGIDAPEHRQTCLDGAGRRYPCGLQATMHMRQLVLGRRLTCRKVTTDRYGRMVAVCQADGMDVGRRMVLDGWALAFVRYSRAYVREERLARRARRGMWRGRFIPPSVWRRLHQRGRWH